MSVNTVKGHAGAIPVSPSLGEIEHEIFEQKNYPVGKRVFYLSIQAIFNAILIGIVAKLLVGLISFITNISFYGKWSFEETSPAGNHLGLFVIILPVIGGLIVGVMARFGSPAIRGHGIPEAMEQILLNESKINPIIIFLKPISAAISIGTGGPFGAEGPIISTGGAFGSLTGQLLKVTPNERKIILAAGACAGMSAIFGTPLSAVLLAIELLLFEFSPRSIIPVSLACITGAAMHFIFFGTAPAFAMPAIPEPSSIAMVMYVLLGVIIGVAASVVSKAVYFVEDMFEHIPMHWMWWPAIGAVVVGVVGYFAPLTLGVGYSNIQNLLSGSLPLYTICTLCFLKFFSWCISLGSGTSGGTLAPLLTIGGALGSLLGMATLRLFPGCEINIMTCALIGMAAMFAGASRALLTSIVFALECTMQPHGLLPLMGACTASYFISFFLMKGSIMTEKIERRGVSTPTAFEPDVLQQVLVKEVLNEESTVLNKENTIKEAREWIKENGINEGQATAFVLVDNEGGLSGTIQRKQVFGKQYADNTLLTEVITDIGPYVYEESRLSLAVDLMTKYELDMLPVIAQGNNKPVIGVLSHKEILSAYSKRRHEGENYQRAISLKRRGIKVILKGKQLFNRN
ncbi:MAG: chloride channel protein [Flavipsychrobacter sp.]|nr:chloride channel protein [Flavipsychrobacter sp.]